MIHKKKLPSVISASLALSLSISALAEVSAAKERYIVKLKPGAVAAFVKEQQFQVHRNVAKASMMHSLAQSVAAITVSQIPKANASTMLLTTQQKAQLEKNHQVAYVERDPKRYLHAEDVPYGITMVEAEKVSDHQTSGVTVCVMDTGYTLTHPDLPANTVTGDNVNGEFNTGSWFIDGHGHGTHVSGTILALGGNNEGVVGVNPSGLLGLHMVKVFNNAGAWAYGSDLVAAIYQCQEAGAQIINMSLGGPIHSQLEAEAFAKTAAEGMLHIASAGNNGSFTLSYPASYDAVVSIAAIDEDGKKASFSQYNRQVELSAPGVKVNSTLPPDRYAKWSGTSMAAPHVTGVVALVWSHFPGCSNTQVREAMGVTAQDLGEAGRDHEYGYGLIKAKALYDYLKRQDCALGSDLPRANFATTADGLTVSFQDKSTDNTGITSHLWNFGDGATSTDQNPTHTYGDEGIYQVSLTVKDTDGNISEVTRSVDVEIVIPPFCEGRTQWQSSHLYAVGDKVFWNGQKYDAISWSRVARPDLYANVWKHLGACEEVTAR